jgi:hypothetical protein
MMTWTVLWAALFLISLVKGSLITKRPKVVERLYLNTPFNVGLGRLCELFGVARGTSIDSIKVYLEQVGTFNFPPMIFSRNEYKLIRGELSFVFDELLDAGYYHMCFEGPARLVGGELRRDARYQTFKVQHAEMSVPKELKIDTPFNFYVRLAGEMPATLDPLVLLKLHRVGNAGSVGTSGKRQSACEDVDLPYIFSTLKNLEGNLLMSFTLDKNFDKHVGNSFTVVAYAFVASDKPLKKSDFGPSSCPVTVRNAVLLGKSEPFTLTQIQKYRATSLAPRLPADKYPAVDVQQILSPTPETFYTPGSTVSIQLAKPISPPDFGYLQERFPDLDLTVRDTERIVEVLMTDVRKEKSIRRFMGRFPNKKRDLVHFMIPYDVNPGNYVLHINNGKSDSVKSFRDILTVCNGTVAKPSQSSVWQPQKMAAITFDTKIAASNFSAFEVTLFVDLAAYVGYVSCQDFEPGSLQVAKFSIKAVDVPAERIEGSTVSLLVTVDGIVNELLDRKHFFIAIAGRHTGGYTVPISMSDNFGISHHDALETCRSSASIQPNVSIRARAFDSSQRAAVKAARSLDLCSGIIPISEVVRDNLSNATLQPFWP